MSYNPLISISANFSLLGQRLAALEGGQILPIPLVQTVFFGELTRRGSGRELLGYQGNGELQILTGDTDIWDIVDNQLVLKGAYGAAPPPLSGPYILTVSDNQGAVSLVTILITPNTAHVAPHPADTSTNHQLQKLFTTSIMRWGDKVLLRTGVYFPGLILPRLTKGAAFTQRAGGPSEPFEENDAGFVRIASEVPYGAMMHNLYVDAVSSPKQEIRIDQINFFRPAAGAVASGQGVANACLMNNTAVRTTYVRITRNRFSSAFDAGFSAPGQGGGDNLYSGIRWLGRPSDPTRCDKTWITDNEFSDVLYGMSLGGRDYVIRNNIIRNVWVDEINGFLIASAPGKCAIEDNFHTDKKYGDGSYHGDRNQANYGNGTVEPIPDGDYFGPQYRGNVIQRGIGRTGFQDGQSFFFSDVPSGVRLLNVVIENNFITQTFTRAISLVGCVDAAVRNNTVLQDQQGDSGALASPNISLTRCTGGTVSGNVVHSPTGTGPGTAITVISPITAATIASSNVYVAPSGYVTTFVAPAYRQRSKAAASLAFLPLLNGPAMVGSSVYAGFVNPDGSSANGTPYVPA